MQNATSASFLKRKESAGKIESPAATNCCNWSASIQQRFPSAFLINSLAARGSASGWLARWLPNPKILLMDEPFGALDPLTRAEMQDMLRDLLHRVQTTVLLVTHDLDEALYLAGRIVLIGEGKILADFLRDQFLQSEQPEIVAYAGLSIAASRTQHLMRTRTAVPHEHLVFVAIRRPNHHAHAGAPLANRPPCCLRPFLIPAGVWLTRSPRWAKPVIGLTNILQTIPSLAMFGFLLPLPWFGERAARIAIVALTAYALLPILRNTYAGSEPSIRP